MRSPRTRRAALLSGLALLASGLLFPASPAAADESGSTVTAVSLEQVFPGEPTWPSTVYPSWSLRVALHADRPVPGESVVLELSENLSLAAVPGVIEDEEGRELARYLTDGRTLTVTYSPAAAEVVDLDAVLGVFVSADSVSTGGGTITAQAESNGTVFPLAAVYSPAALRAGTVGTWTTSAEGRPQFLARSIFEAAPEHAAAGGQWFGMGGTTVWSGRFEPVTGTTRVYALDALPTQTADLTDADARLRPGLDYTVDETDAHGDDPVFGITVPAPEDGYIIIEQLYDLTDPGAVLVTAPGEALPESARGVHGIGTQAISGSLDDHAAGTDSVGGIYTMQYFAGSGGTASANAATVDISAERTIDVERAVEGASSALVSVEMQNTGDVTAAVTVTDVVSPVDADLAVTDAAATAGTVTTADARISWHGVLAPGASATITYQVAATTTSEHGGLLTWEGRAEAVDDRAPETVVSVALADAELAVAAPGVIPPVEPEDPATPTEAAPTDPDGTLATTGQDTAGVLTAAVVGGLLLLAGITAVSGSRAIRRSRS